MAEDEAGKTRWDDESDADSTEDVDAEDANESAEVVVEKESSEPPARDGWAVLSILPAPEGSGRRFDAKLDGEPLRVPSDLEDLQLPSQIKEVDRLDVEGPHAEVVRLINQLRKRYRGLHVNLATDVDDTENTADTFETEGPDEETGALDSEGAYRLGILGGTEAGKTYLFQAMVYRSWGTTSGALARYLRKASIQLYSARDGHHDDEPVPQDRAFTRENIVDFLRDYERWIQLPRTKGEMQKWYRFRINYRSGYFGQRRSAIDLDFFDPSGERAELPLGKGDVQAWVHRFGGASVMVFCLPLWAAFPGDRMTDGDHERRDAFLQSFYQVVGNYVEMRESLPAPHPVKSILALTWADDGRGGLKTLLRNWILPYLQDPKTYLRKLHTGGNVVRYLANAARVSRALRQGFDDAEEKAVQEIPYKLDFGSGDPWILPVSSIDGRRLRDAERGHCRGRPPVPVHVELPLLVALCERENALM